MIAKLIITQNGTRVKTLPLESPLLTIGRRHINDLHLDHPGVSGNHARIHTVGNESFIEDRNSTNGTYINLKRIDKAPLIHNDHITIGGFELIYFNESASQTQQDDDKTVIMAPKNRSPNPKPAVSPQEKIMSAQTSHKVTQADNQNDTQHDIHEAQLTVIKGEGAGNSIELSKMITRVKGSHGFTTAISKKEDGYYLLNTHLEDLAPSINGRVVPVGSIKLVDGDIVGLGDNQLKFSSEE